MRKQSSCSSSSSSSVSASPLVRLFLLLALIFIIKDYGIVRVAEGGKRRVHIPDDLEDVIDDGEDEEWKRWGEKSTPSQDFEFDPPPPMDFTKMDTSQIQDEMMNRHSGPSFGFVKLRLGVRRSPDMVTEIAMKWTKVLKTGSIEANFKAVDTNTIMFTMQRGKDTTELKEFVLNQPEAYEMKIGDHVVRRPGDPPLEEVIEKLRIEKNEAQDHSSTESSELLKRDEL
ncbi:uncharacterized protein LOC122059357 [Macadamia integrifolia]|uniref:uncharacterized protein LOC122059357 n=1 Tax=Macadamia integrifolia TaxID=60698 RepID=UPI001C530F40|nr:uncharacterized protein LOC122059357 [Macadamia integrifolia]